MANNFVVTDAPTNDK